MITHLSVVLENMEEYVNQIKPEQSHQHFANNIFKCIFLKDNFCILIQRLNKYLYSISSDNGLVLDRHQAIIWTNGDAVYLSLYVPTQEVKYLQGLKTPWLGNPQCSSELFHGFKTWIFPYTVLHHILLPIVIYHA